MPNPTPRESRFRPDIEGLRALAIGLVLVYHAGAPLITGGFVGVDVFFVISGFLITGLLIRELESTGRISLMSFWGRRAKRLLPASLLVLIFTAVGTALVLPNTTWRSIGGDIAAAALYAVNWRFAIGAVDYDAEGTGVSPVKHYWSLAVEEQYYIVWPILLVLLAWLVLRRVHRDRYRFWIGIALAIIVIPSFLWSVYYTGENPSAAFFVTTTRLWELGIGAAIAVGAAHWGRIPKPVAVTLGWAGLATVVVSAFVLDGPSAWPGAGALAPVLGTAAIIIASTGRDPIAFGVGSLLAFRPFVWIGGLSYSWYLWHWPFLILAEAYFGELRFRWALVVVLLSGVMAWLSLKFVENPIRRSAPLAKSNVLAVSTGLNLTAVGVITGLALILAVPSGAAVGNVDTSKIGATQVAPSQPDSSDGSGAGPESPDVLPTIDYAAIDEFEFIVPAPADATSDMPPFNEECKATDDSPTPVVCEYGDPSSQVTVVAVGDSKIQQMESALIGAAKEHDWHLITYFKSGCVFADPQFTVTDAESRNCADWNREALRQIVALQPDAVVTTGRLIRDGRAAGGDETPGAEMIASWWTQLQDAGITVIPILDNPAPPFEVYDCVAENLKAVSACSFDRERAIDKSGASYQLAAMKIAGVTSYVDLADIVCPVAERCPAVLGNVLVYRQGSHITNTYVESMTGVLGERLDPLLVAAARD